MFSLTQNFVEKNTTISDWEKYYIWREWMRYAYCSDILTIKALHLRIEALMLCKTQLEHRMSFHWLSRAMLTAVLSFQSYRELAQDEKADDLLADTFNFICNLPRTPEFEVISISVGKLLMPAHHIHFVRKYLEIFNCINGETEHWNNEIVGLNCISHFGTKSNISFNRPNQKSARILTFKQRSR